MFDETIQTIIEHSSRCVSLVSAASLCLGEWTCTQVEWTFTHLLVMMCILDVVESLRLEVWMMTYLWNMCHVRMQTTDVA